MCKNNTAKRETNGNLYAYTVLQNLKDAGCDRETAERFITLEGTGDTQEQLKLLSIHRKRLLDRIHSEEKRIDCLDYLVYQLQKNMAAK